MIRFSIALAALAALLAVCNADAYRAELRWDPSVDPAGRPISYVADVFSAIGQRRVDLGPGADDVDGSKTATVDGVAENEPVTFQIFAQAGTEISPPSNCVALTATLPPPDCSACPGCLPCLPCPSAVDCDDDGLLADDPCPKDARNLCGGAIVAKDTSGRTLRLNMGRLGACAGDKTDCAGYVWKAEFAANAGTSTYATGAIAGLERIFGCASAQTTDLFLCERYDPSALPELSYAYQVANGRYVVNFYFANTYAGTAAVGSRIFDVLVEGRLALDDFDRISAAGGTRRAVVRSVLADVVDGSLRIEFRHVKENPALNALEVVRLP